MTAASNTASDSLIVNPAVLSAEADQLVAQGLALHKAGQALQAEPYYRAALDKYPHHGDATHMLAVVTSQKGQQAEAEALAREAVGINPEHTAYQNTLGRVLLLQGRMEEGLAVLQKALDLAPQNHEAYFNVAEAMFAQGQYREAERAYRRALQFKATHAAAAFGLGRALWMQGDQPGALPWFQLADFLQPADPTIRNQLGVAYMVLGHREEALQAFQWLVQHYPNSPEVHANLGVLYGHVERDKAYMEYKRAIELNPHLPTALDGFMEIARQLCAWDDFLATVTQRIQEDVRARIAAGQPASLRSFTALYLPFSAAELLAIGRSESAQLAQDVGPALHRIPREDQPERLRIAYLSSDARNHPVAHLLQGMFAMHDRSRFEIFFYSTGVDDGSPQRRAIQQGAEHFIEARGMPSVDLAQRIADDRVHILIDLMGHTADSRMSVLARRPAPIQIHYLGFPGSTGADFVDYIIADPVIMPPERKEERSEAVIYLPVYQINSHRSLPAGPEYHRADFGVPDEAFLFYCFNNNYKIDPDTFACWMRILHAVPQGRLCLLATAPQVMANLRSVAQGHGVDPDRLLFAGYLDQAANIARQRLMDLFLDTPHYNAGATAADVLWAGVPLLTVRGHSYITRVGESLLRHLGLEQSLLAPDLAAYEAMAIALAQDPERLACLRAQVAAAVPTATLFDTSAQVRRLEESLLTVWQHYREGQPPADIPLLSAQPW
jgi:predicted O-linked N-acetylglucosamine transferase (SPINDLY family)